MASLEFAEISPSFRFVIFTGSVSLGPDTLMLPSEVPENFGPLLSPTCTVLKEGLSTVANVILPFLSCFTSRFLPAIISIVLPALMDSPFAFTVPFPFLVPSPALAFNVKAALFTAFTTESTVAILPSSPSVTFIVPGVVPASIPPVTTFNPLVGSVVIVVPSVLTFTPSLFTSKDLSAAFTVILLSVVFKPLPKLTLYLTVDVLFSVVSTTAVVPLPSAKFTVSYGFTKSFSSLLFCKFQPAFNTSPTVAALFLIPSTSLGAVALVVGAVVLALEPCKLPATFVIALPPLFKPSWLSLTVFASGAFGFVKETPVGVIFTILLLASLNSALVKPLNAFANLNRIVPSFSYLTPILLSVNSPVAPPLRFKRLSAILLATIFLAFASSVFFAASSPTTFSSLESSAP